MKPDKAPRLFRVLRRVEARGSAREPKTERADSPPAESQTDAAPSPDAADRQHFADIARQFDVGMLTTRQADGTLTSRPMYIAGFDDDGTIWVITSTESALVPEVRESTRVSFSMQGRLRFVSVSATAQLVRDQKELEKRWKPSYRVWFPNGPADEHAQLLKLRPTEAEYWDQSGAFGVRLMVQAARALLKRRSLSEALLVGHGRIRLGRPRSRKSHAQQQN